MELNSPSPGRFTCDNYEGWPKQWVQSPTPSFNNYHTSANYSASHYYWSNWYLLQMTSRITLDCARINVSKLQWCSPVHLVQVPTPVSSSSPKSKPVRLTRQNVDKIQHSQYNHVLRNSNTIPHWWLRHLTETRWSNYTVSGKKRPP